MVAALFLLPLCRGTLSVSVSYSGVGLSRREERQSDKEVIEDICGEIGDFSFRPGARFEILDCGLYRI